MTAIHPELEEQTRATAPEDPMSELGAVGVLKRGIAATPELKVGLVFTVGMAISNGAGRLAVPIAIQQILDRGVLGDDGFRPGFVYPACVVAVVAISALFALSRATYLRLVIAAENSLYGLRVRAFEHIHRLALADHTEKRRGDLVARVTSDIETLAQFTQWGAVSWIVNGSIVVGTITAMAVYSWQLTLMVLAIFAPLTLIMPRLQRRQLAAYDQVRVTVGDCLSQVSEAVGGADVIRAYDLKDRARTRLRDAMESQYRAHLRAAIIFAGMFPLGDIFAAISVAAVAGVGAIHATTLGITTGELIAFLFLTNLLQNPISELSEVFDQTQTAIAGWRKVLTVLDLPVEVAEPESGLTLPSGALGVTAEGIGFSYRTGGRVLHGVSVDIPAGTSVAIVGETGSGKTTFAKLLCRLADPTDGVIRVGGVPLARATSESRNATIRMVPQDGFLFEGTIADNVALGRLGATRADVEGAFDSLGLSEWVDRLNDGVDTDVGERGANLSVGERQLVALARAQLASPGLLVLDEATSGVDPETEQALAQALRRLTSGRTVISVAHRLSTAEAADLVLVFDAGRLIEVGSHDEMVDGDGVYSRLHRSWVGATRTEEIQTPNRPSGNQPTIR